MKIEDMTLEQAQAALRRARQVAIRVSRDQGWCAEGRDDALAEIGLDPIGHGAASTVVVTFEVVHEPGDPPPPSVIRSILEEMFRSEFDDYHDVEDDGAFRIEDDVAISVKVTPKE